MRTIRTCILRLLIDPISQNNLKGSILPLPDGDPQSFKDQESLVDLLKGLIQQSQESPPRIEISPTHLSDKDE